MMKNTKAKPSFPCVFLCIHLIEHEKGRKRSAPTKKVGEIEKKERHVNVSAR